MVYWADKPQKGLADYNQWIIGVICTTFCLAFQKQEATYSFSLRCILEAFREWCNTKCDPKYIGKFKLTLKVLCHRAQNVIISSRFGQFVSNLDTKMTLERSSHWKHKFIPPSQIRLDYFTTPQVFEAFVLYSFTVKWKICTPTQGCK